MEKGYIRKSISIGIDLWNEIPQHLINENFSGFIQDAIRSKLKSLKTQNIREILDCMDNSQIESLHKEIKKRGF